MRHGTAGRGTHPSRWIQRGGSMGFLLVASVCINVLQVLALVRMDSNQKELEIENKHLREILRRKGWI